MTKKENMNTQENRNSNDRKSKKRDNTLVNYNIRCGKVRIVGDGQPVVMSKDDALQLAQSKGLDLVQISFDVENHLAVCKIIDFGKFKYEQSKREKEAKKIARANTTKVKTVQFGITTDENDVNRLVAQVRKFLEEGDKVKIAMRTKRKVDFAKSLMSDLLKKFDDVAMLDSNPTLTGRELICVLRPIKAYFHG